MRYKTQTVSDIIRDGLGVELINESNEQLAEVFRCDKDKTVILNTFDNDVPISAIALLLERAKERLDTFEGGEPIMWPS